MSLEVQAICYEAMFETFWSRPWFEGLYIWKWFPEGSSRRSLTTARRQKGFTPQGKPSEQVLRNWYEN